MRKSVVTSLSSALTLLWMASASADVSDKAEKPEKATKSTKAKSAEPSKPSKPSKPDKEAKSEQTAAPADRAGSVQAGVQALTEALAAHLKGASGDGSLRRVAVLPFESLDKDASSFELGRLSAELLSARLALRPGVIQVERARLTAVVQELQRSEKGELSPNGAASVGKLLGANQVVLGSIAAAGPQFVMTARLVDAETGQVLGAADQNVPREGFIALSEEVVETKSRSGAALRSTAVPGWGQFYNGDSGRGIGYLSLAGGLAATAVTSVWLGKEAEDDYNQNTVDTVGRRSEANGHYDRVNVALMGLGVVWATSILDAYLSGADVKLMKLPDGGQTELGAATR